MANGVSKATWVKKFEKLPAWKQTLIRKMYRVDPMKLKDEKRYKDPDTLIRAVSNRLKREGRDIKGGVVSGKMDNKAGREYDAKFLLENYKERLFRKDVAIRKAIEKLTMFGELGISEVIDLLEEAIQE